MLPRDKVIWSRECTPTMAVAAAPLHEKVRTKTAWILVLLVMGSMLMCRGPIYFVFSLINLSILTNHTVDVNPKEDGRGALSFVRFLPRRKTAQDVPETRYGPIPYSSIPTLHFPSSAP